MVLFHAQWRPARPFKPLQLECMPLRTCLQPFTRPKHIQRKPSAHCYAVAGDLYEALGIPSTATKAHIKAAYRRAMRVCHPDVDSSATAQAQFDLVQEAYKVLVSERTRRHYNRQLQQAQHQKGQTHSRGAKRGRDVHAVVGLALDEAARGVCKTVHVMVLDDCKECQGGEDGMPEVAYCYVCHGAGEVQTTLHKIGVNGVLLDTAWRTCPGCGGEGSRVKQYCRKCGGRGRARAKRGVQVTIPPGVDNGSMLRVRGQGDKGQGPGGNNKGDIYFMVHVHDHPYLHRQGADLYSRLPVCFTDAILGADVRVPTLWGVRALRIPAGTQHDALLPLHGAGLRRPGAQRPQQDEGQTDRQTDRQTDSGVVGKVEDVAGESTAVGDVSGFGDVSSVGDDRLEGGLGDRELRVGGIEGASEGAFEGAVEGDREREFEKTAHDRGVHYFRVVVQLPPSHKLSAGARADLEGLRTLLMRQERAVNANG